MDEIKTIILIRHGKTAYNALGKYMGRGVDEELSDDGIKEIIAKRDGLRAISEGAVIFTGPLKRAKDTAGLEGIACATESAGMTKTPSRKAGLLRHFVTRLRLK